jgi:hemoglobin/transferrin/lactoferrin receptor protein
MYERKKITAEFYALYNGNKDSADYNLRGEDNQVYSADAINGFTPAWITWNIRGNYKITEVASVQLAVENISDRYYRVFASGISAAGRNIIMSLRLRL